MIALAHKHNPTPIFEVLRMLGPKHLLLRPLWDNGGTPHKVYRIRKAVMKACGYYPMEVADAIVTQLR